MLAKEQLEQQLLTYNQAYRTGEAVISDNEFNDILDEYKQRFPEDYETFKLKLFDDEGQNHDGKFKLPFVTGSLNKAKFLEGPIAIEYYLNTFAAETKTSAKSFFVSITPKLDGCSLTLIYKDGKLNQALTRGDGFWGEDKTDHAKHINYIPTELEHVKYAVIKGEVIIPSHKWEDLKTKVKYSAARNAAAGILNRKTASAPLCEYLDFVAYRLLDIKMDDNYDMPDDLKCSLKKLDMMHAGKADPHLENKTVTILEHEVLDHIYGGLTLHNATDYSTLHAPVDDDMLLMLKRTYDMYRRSPTKCPWDIDGIVVDIGGAAAAPLVSKDRNEYYPKHMFAIKFDYQQAVAVVNHIEWQLSKAGYLKPVAVFKDGVSLGGAMVNRCTLYNAQYVMKQGIQPKTRIAIVRSGDVIPKCLGVLTNSRAWSRDRVFPSVCPVCGSPVEYSGVDLVCSNPQCQGRQIKEVTDFLGKLEVNYADVATLNSFGIQTITDILTWKAPDKKKKLYSRFETELKKVWRAPKEKIWAALNWNGVSWETWKKIFSFMPLDAVKDALDKNLSEVLKSISDNVWGVAERTILQIEETWPSIKGIYEAIVSDERYQNQEYAFDRIALSDVFSGLSICFSGSFSKKKAELEKLAEINGAKVKHSFSKTSALNILVTNTNVETETSLSAKEKLALETGIQILSEADFLERCEIKDKGEQ